MLALQVSAIAFGLLGLLVGAVVTAIAAARSRSSSTRRLAFGLALLTVAAGLAAWYAAWRDIHYWDGVEWNSEITVAEVVGSWRANRGASLEFWPDGGCTDSEASCGRWNLAPDSLGSLHTHGSFFQVFKTDGGFLMIRVRDPNQDPDEWNRGRGFVKAMPTDGG